MPIAATYDPLPGLVQMSFGALLVLPIGALVLRWSLRSVGEAVRERRWRTAAAECVVVPLGASILWLGILMLLELPTEQRAIRVAAFETDRSGEWTLHYVHDPQGHRTQVPDVSAARQVGSVYRCRIHHALVFGIDLGSCQPSDSAVDSRRWRTPGR
ncbi:MAG: hypothetical protein Q7T55_16880 [Solirubrobacteraceae bacterium]|nr:hypothetical protein [Solirubrobacteraceae bacterium]